MKDETDHNIIQEVIMFRIEQNSEVKTYAKVQNTNIEDIRPVIM